MKIKDSDILMIDKDGNIKEVFPNQTEATKAAGIKSRSLICKICKEEYGSCSGYYWLTGKSYKKKQKNSTYSKWLKENVKITKNINRDSMPIVKLDKITYELIDKYDSLNEAAKLNDLDNKNGYDSIIKCCKLTRKSAKGYMWLLEEDYNKLSKEDIMNILNKINNINPDTKKINKYTMPVVKLDKNTYNLIDRYDNVIEAAKDNNIDTKSGYDAIIKCCRFGRKSVHGYSWILESDYKKMTVEEIRLRFEGKLDSFVGKKKRLDNTPVVKLKPYEFEFIKVYPSIIEASKDTNANKDGISKCCKFQRKTSGGYSWMYLDDFKKYSLEEIKSMFGKIFWN